ncbi:MAG: YncE family protein [Terriglobia bacterium]|jgi:DNA-binding beta-propeller fold protein YncE
MDQRIKQFPGGKISMARLICGIVLATLAAATFSARPLAAADGNYHLLKKVVLGGEGGWDYLNCDSEARRIYISRGTHVMVVDADTYAVVGDIPGTEGVHGIALAPELGRGFTSNGRSNSVTIFDLKTLKVLGTAPTGEGPDAIVYDPASRRVFTLNGRAGTATAVDAATGKLAGTVTLGGRPEFAAADGQGHIYNNLEDKSEIVQIDSQKLTVTARWPLAPGEEPSGLAIDREHRRLFAGCHNKMMVVMDADSGKVLATPAIGQGVDANGFDPGTQLAFSSNGDGTLTIVHEDSPEKFTPVASVPTQRGARTMAVDLKTHHIFLVTAEFGPPPPPTPEHPRTRPQAIPGSFTLLVVGE